MTQETEIEFKTLLTFDEFQRLQNGFPFPKQPVEQINYYFETKTFHLKKQNCALRIRKKRGKYTLTLKESFTKEVLETHDPLTENDFNQWIKGQMTGKNHVTKRIEGMDIDINDLIFYGALETERYTFEEDGYKYFLDKSAYLGNVDFEFELEAPSYTNGKKSFQQILQRFHIPEGEPVTKIARFFSALQ